MQDSYEYENLAYNIIHHQIFYCGNLDLPIDLDLYTKRPPFYSLFLAIFMLFNSPYWIITLVQNILSIATIYLVCKIFCNIQSKAVPWKFLLFLIILYPAQFIYVNLFMAEILFQFLLTLFLFLAIKYIQNKKISIVYLACFVLLLCVFTKPVMLYFCYITGFISLAFGVWKKKWAFGFCGLLIFASLTGYQYINYCKTGYFHFSSIQTIGMLYYNLYLLLCKTQGVVEADATVRSLFDISRTMPFADGHQFVQNAVISQILENPLLYTIQHLKGSFIFLVDPGRFDQIHFFFIDPKYSAGFQVQFNSLDWYSFVSLIFKLPWVLMLILSMIACVNIFKILLSLLNTRNNIPIGIMILIACIPLYVALINGINSASRFCVPVEPMILILAISGYQNIDFQKMATQYSFLKWLHFFKRSEKTV